MVGIKIRDGKPYFDDGQKPSTFTDRVVGTKILKRDITAHRSIDEVEDVKKEIRNRILWAVSLTAGLVKIIDVLWGWLI
jgi:hypothetical protein